VFYDVYAMDCGTVEQHYATSGDHNVAHTLHTEVTDCADKLESTTGMHRWYSDRDAGPSDCEFLVKTHNQNINNTDKCWCSVFIPTEKNGSCHM